VTWIENQEGQIKGLRWRLPFGQAPFFDRTTSPDFPVRHAKIINILPLEDLELKWLS